MPRGTDPLTVQWAAREFARVEFADHRYVMVLHEHQANPHVHLSVKAASKQGKRLNPRKADLQRWRETFAERLGERGIDAEASPQITRGGIRRSERLWQRKARENGRIDRESEGVQTTVKLTSSRRGVAKAWCEIARALAESDKVGRPHARQASRRLRAQSAGRSIHTAAAAAAAAVTTGVCRDGTGQGGNARSASQQRCQDAAATNTA